MQELNSVTTGVGRENSCTRRIRKRGICLSLPSCLPQISNNLWQLDSATLLDPVTRQHDSGRARKASQARGTSICLPLQDPAPRRHSPFPIFPPIL